MTKKILKYQGWHALALFSLLVAVIFFSKQFPATSEGQLFGLNTTVWLWTGIAASILHQVLLVFFWRAELYDHWLSKRFGDKEKAFKAFSRAFLILLVGRPITAFLLAISNRATLTLSWPLRIGISLLLFAGFAWMMYSVTKYFGIINAFGRDHFYPEDYRGKAIEKRGLFKYVDNAMYTVGFAIVWMPAVLFASQAGLLLAAFSHLYIWVHWFTLEKPDMKEIYAE